MVCNSAANNKHNQGPPKWGFLHAERRTHPTKSFGYMSFPLTRTPTMCLWLLKVAVSSCFRSSERFWHEGFSGARRNVIKLVNLLSLCHLFVIFTHTAFPAVSLKALFFITQHLFNINSLSVIFFFFNPRPQNQLDTLIGPPIHPFCSCSKGFCLV